MAREMPNARYVYCVRPFDEIAVSWSKPTSLAGEHLRSSPIESQRDFYRFCLDRATMFGFSVRHFTEVRLPEFVRNPSSVMATLACSLGLTHFDFDVSQVGRDKDIKQVLRP